MRMPVISPFSVFCIHSRCIAVRAVMVDLVALNPCWLLGRRLLISKNLVTWSQIIFSRTLEAATRQLMGLKLFTSVFEPFFRIGITIASFQWEGTTPDKIEALKMWVSGIAITFIPESRFAWEIPSLPLLFFKLHFFHCLVNLFHWDSFEWEFEVFIFHAFFKKL